MVEKLLRQELRFYLSKMRLDFRRILILTQTQRLLLLQQMVMTHSRYHVSILSHHIRSMYHLLMIMEINI
jgi:hypothetical protein